MNIFHGVILGIVEGVTEFLPISSTGHLILIASKLGLEQTEFLKSFEIAIQLGAILSVIVLYWKTLVRGLDIWKRVLVAFLPTACIGLVFYKIAKRFLLSNNAVVLWSLGANAADLANNSLDERQNLNLTVPRVYISRPYAPSNAANGRFDTPLRRRRAPIH